MKPQHILYLCIIAIFLSLPPTSSPLSAQQNLSGELQIRDFLLQSSVLVSDDGGEISTSGFQPRGWYPVKVPTTVLSGLVKNGVYQDPYVGMNNMEIPDANREFSKQYDLEKYSHLGGNKNPWEDPYWYRAEFQLPGEFETRQIWLRFDGINYRADVFLNGVQVANAEAMAGMFEQFIFDVTENVYPGATNFLAVKIYPLDYPGMPGQPQLEALGPFGENGGPTGDIGKNVTMQSSVGWDWIPAVRDRNMGIWQEVYLSTTGPVDIRYPHVISDLPLPDTSTAELTLVSELVNASDQTVSGELIANITPKNFAGQIYEVREPVTIEPFETDIIRMSPATHPELEIINPALWWPLPYGKPNLYTLTYSFVSDGDIFDSESYNLGIREIDSRVIVANDWHRREFYINGQKIQIKGGAWVPDMMLNRDTRKLYNELKLSREANFNMVRIWGGGVTPPEAFFDFCDELGVLVWHDFWITGDAQGTFGKGTRDWPLEGDVFLSNARNTIKRLRHHPGLLVWTAGNEGYPRQELYTQLRNELIAEMDGTRPFLPTSGYANPDPSWGLSWPDDSESGAYSGGPYHYVPPETYYTLVEKGRDWLFKDEVGIPSVPPIESLNRFIPDLSQDQGEPFPLNETWGYHDACEGNGKYSLYHKAILDRYGESETVGEYTQKAQFINAENYRAIFEATNHKLDSTAGVILWKTNPAWPSVIWQVYDWYLRPNAGYYYAQQASEQLHVQLNLDDFNVVVVNLRNKAANNLTLNAGIYDEQMQIVYTYDRQINVDPAGSMEVFHLNIPYEDSSSVRFVDLTLTNPLGDVLSDNFYWLSSSGKFEMLNELDEVDLLVSQDLRETPEEFNIEITLRNPSQGLAFFINPQLTDNRNGDEILPTFWSDNYINLLPGESKTLQASVSKEDVQNGRPYLHIRGWNINPKTLNF